jgi:hypothetical protein
MGELYIHHSMDNSNIKIDGRCLIDKATLTIHGTSQNGTYVHITDTKYRCKLCNNMSPYEHFCYCMFKPKKK